MHVCAQLAFLQPHTRFDPIFNTYFLLYSHQMPFSIQLKIRLFSILGGIELNTQKDLQYMHYVATNDTLPKHWEHPSPPLRCHTLDLRMALTCTMMPMAMKFASQTPHSLKLKQSLKYSKKDKTIQHGPIQQSLMTL